MREPVLAVRNLKTYFYTDRGVVKAVDGVSFQLYPGETLGLVGESGCGKSMTALSIMGLVPHPGRIVSGEIRLLGENLAGKSDRELRRWRGSRMAMIFQDPLTTLNPVLRVGQQVTESIRIHYGDGAWPGNGRPWEWLTDPLRIRRRRLVWERAVELLEKVGIPAPSERMRAYPHEMSGGMRQRVMIAIALSCNPALLLADEPTTALDVTIQAQIMQLMKELKEKTNTSIILITHDLGIVVDLCDRVIVMYAGQIVETGTKWEIFKNPQHPYTKGLLKSLPRLNQAKDEPLVPIYGTPPDMIKPPKGCGFCSRCSEAMRICELEDPDWTTISETQRVRCWLQHTGNRAEAVAGGRGVGA